MHKLARLDHAHVWHPFTQMRDWLRREPIVITHGRGAVLRDAKGREYLDANASIWTNLHGHNHPRINAAIRAQLGKIAHVSALGLANGPAVLLAERLIRSSACPPEPTGRRGELGQAEGSGQRTEIRGQRTEDSLDSVFPTHCDISDLPAPGSRLPASPFPPKTASQSSLVNPQLRKVFFSDDGSTAVEVALKMAYEFARRSGRSAHPRFLSMAGAYHGDTVGAVSLGHIDLFHKAYAGLTFKSDEVMAPYCYRCPFNRAKPERADARAYRRCNWECVGQVERKFERQRRGGNPYAGFVFEPLIQGAAGMIPQPTGWLRRVAEIARGHGALLIADEVLTAFGRTGDGKEEGRRKKEEVGNLGRGKEKSKLAGVGHGWFASHSEGVQPDLLCLAKGLTGGYLPMAATLTTEEIFGAFLGEYEEFKTFFHGHSYTANPLAAAAALASLEILDTAASCRARARLELDLDRQLSTLWDLPQVGDVRQVGLMAGIELVRDWHTREPFDLRERAGIRVCEAMARRGILTRPIGNVIVLMPPYCTTAGQVEQMVTTMKRAIRDVCE